VEDASNAVPTTVSDLVQGTAGIASGDVDDVAQLGLPLDASGLLSEPATPKQRKLSRGKDKFLRRVRKSRAVCLRTPVVSIIIGRQLAAPVTKAVRAISKGEVPDVVGIVSTVARVPVPLRGPIPA